MLISRFPLPSNRVFVIKGGARFPWTPPELPEAPKERVYIALEYDKNAVTAFPPKAAEIHAIAVELGIAAKPKPKRKCSRKFERPGRWKAVVCLLPNGKKVRYPSLAEASRASGRKGETIRRQCKFKTFSRYGGGIFRFEGDALPTTPMARAAQGVYTPRGKSAPVICRDISGKETRYPSMKAAAEATGVATRAISRMCVGKGKHPGKMSKYRFSYAELKP